MNNLETQAMKIAAAIDTAGGVPLAVGGFVRDQFLGKDSKDIDIEVHALSVDATLEALSGWKLDLVGASFGVIKVFIGDGEFIDVSFPRKDNKVGEGHRGFEVSVDPFMGFSEAFRRRDLTINAMGRNLITGELVDPFGGHADLKKKVLREVDPVTFAEDPLRALRVAQFASRFGFTPSEQLTQLCSELDLTQLPTSRLEQEFEKMFSKGMVRSLGLSFMAKANLDKQLGLHFNEGAFLSVDVLHKDAGFPVFLAVLVENLPLWRAEEVLAKLTTRKSDMESALNLCQNVSEFLNVQTFPQVRALSLKSNLRDLNFLASALGFRFQASLVMNLAKTAGVGEGPLKPLLQGRDLLDLGFKPGPKMGDVLKAVLNAQVEGDVSSKADALDWVKKHF